MPETIKPKFLGTVQLVSSDYAYFVDFVEVDTSGIVVFNEIGDDRDFRFEADANTNLLSLDGGLQSGVGAVGLLGAAAVEAGVGVYRPATTLTASTDYADLKVAPTAAVTVPTGTTAVVASAWFEEPNITATGTVTEAATVYIQGAPTEGTDNFALLIDGGDVNLAGGAILAQSATTGFTFIPRIATGAPSGTPAGIQAGNVAMCFDVTNGTLEIYDGSSWLSIATV